jgi:hypothetical protein
MDLVDFSIWSGNCNVSWYNFVFVYFFARSNMSSAFKQSDYCI